MKVGCIPDGAALFPVLFPQIWNHNLISDEFLGQVVLTGDPSDRQLVHTLHLQDRGNRRSNDLPGTIAVMLLSSNILTNV